MQPMLHDPHGTKRTNNSSQAGLDLPGCSLKNSGACAACRIALQGRLGLPTIYTKVDLAALSPKQAPVGEAQATGRAGVRGAVLAQAGGELFGQDAQPAVQLSGLAGLVERLGRQHGLGQFLHLQPPASPHPL